jgi:hypothetical protein
MEPRRKAIIFVVGFVVGCVGVGLFAKVAPVAFPWVLLAGLLLTVLVVLYKGALEFFEEREDL